MGARFVAAFRTIGVLTMLLTGGSAAFATTPDEYVQDARHYLEKGEYQSAVIQLKNALQRAPKNAQARYLLGHAELKMGDPASAEKEFQRALRLGIGKEKVLPDLAQAYLMQGEPGKVLNEIDVGPKAPAAVHATVLALRGRAYLALKHKDKADDAFAKALKLDPKSVDALLGAARLRLIDNKIGEAGKLVSRALSADKHSAEAWLTQGDVHRLQGKLAEAESDFNHALRLEPGNLTGLLDRAAVYIGRKKLAKAQADIKRVLQVQGNNPLANYMRAVIDYQKKDLSGAQDALTRVQRVAPDYTPSYLLMGAIHYRQGQLEQAESDLSQYVTDVPNHIPARKLLAATYIKLHRPEDAIRVLKAAKGAMDKDPQLMSLLGSAYMQKGDAVQGVKYLQKAVKLAPDQAAIRTQLALSQLAAGDTKHAIGELQSAVNLGQGLFQADMLLVLAHLQQGQYDKALAAARHMAKKLPHSPVPQNLIGAAYLGKKNIPEARKYFAKALSLKPQFSIAEMNLARLDIAAGHTKDAQTHFKNILSYDEGNADALMGLAALAKRRGDTKGAIRWLEQANSKNPNAIKPAAALAQLYLESGATLKALTVTRDLQENRPNQPAVLRVLGMAQLASGETASAVTSFSRLTDREPKSPQAHFLLATAYVQLKQFKRAEDSLDAALKLDRTYIPAELALAQLKLRNGNSKEALEIAHRIEKTLPKAPEGYTLEGNVYVSLKNYGQAIVAYNEAFERRQSATLAIKLSQLYRKTKQERKAPSPLVRYLKDHGRDYDVRKLLASLYQSENRNKEAIHQYERLLKVQPKDPVVLNNLAWLYEAQGDPRSVEYAQRAYDLQSDRPEIADTLGWMLLRHGKVQRGLVLLEDAATHAPDIAEISYHLAVGLDKVGRTEEARNILERLIKEKRRFPERDETKALLKKLKGK